LEREAGDKPLRYWHDVEVERAQKTPTGQLASPIPVSSLIVGETLPDYALDQHSARREAVISSPTSA
jgi:hypothetical protein